MKHKYMNEECKIYESKEVEIAREAEIENSLKSCNCKNKELQEKKHDIDDKYGHTGEADYIIAGFKYEITDKQDI